MNHISDKLTEEELGSYYHTVHITESVGHIKFSESALRSINY